MLPTCVWCSWLFGDLVLRGVAAKERETESRHGRRVCIFRAEWRGGAWRVVVSVLLALAGTRARVCVCVSALVVQARAG